MLFEVFSLISLWFLLCLSVWLKAGAVKNGWFILLGVCVSFWVHELYTWILKVYLSNCRNFVSLEDFSNWVCVISFWIKILHAIFPFLICRLIVLLVNCSCAHKKKGRAKKWNLLWIALSFCNFCLLGKFL